MMAIDLSDMTFQEVALGCLCMLHQGKYNNVSMKRAFCCIHTLKL